MSKKELDGETSYKNLVEEINLLRIKYPEIKQLIVVGGIDVPGGKRTLNFTTYFGDDLDNAINMVNIAKAQLGYTIEDNKKKTVNE